MTIAADSLVCQSAKLGPVPYRPTDVVRFAEGLPGFERLRDFLIVTRDECAPFVFLTAVADPDVTLPLLPLGLVAPPAVDAAAAAAGRALWSSGEPLAAYAVVSIARDAAEVLANLRAPVLVDLDARRGAQVILADESLPVALPLGA
jgi:flagellar assembly factor FliW